MSSVRNGNAFDDIHALSGQRVVFHVAHRDEAVDPLKAEPMNRIRHELLKAGVLHAGHAFGALEIRGGRIAALLTLTGVIDEKLGDLAQRAALLAIIDDDAETAFLGAARAFLDAVNQVRTAGADIRAEIRLSRCTRRGHGR